MVVSGRTGIFSTISSTSSKTVPVNGLNSAYEDPAMKVVFRPNYSNTFSSVMKTAWEIVSKLFLLTGLKWALPKMFNVFKSIVVLKRE